MSDKVDRIAKLSQRFKTHAVAGGKKTVRIVSGKASIWMLI